MKKSILILLASCSIAFSQGHYEYSFDFSAVSGQTGQATWRWGTTSVARFVLNSDGWYFTAPGASRIDGTGSTASFQFDTALPFSQTPRFNFTGNPQNYFIPETGGTYLLTSTGIEPVPEPQGVFFWGCLMFLTAFLARSSRLASPF